MKVDSEELKSKIIEKIKGNKPLLKRIIMVCLIMSIMLGVAFIYLTNLDDGIYKEGDKTNVPFAVSQYTNNVEIDDEGKVTVDKTARELWDEMVKNNNRITNYLSGPEELVKLMNAQLVTQYPDTRKDTSKAYDWDKLNDPDSKEIQGIIKFKRAYEDGTTDWITYVPPDKFQAYIDEYNRSGNEKAKEKAMKHFTINLDGDSFSDSDIGTIPGNGEFKKYDLSADKLKKIANLCQQEQGTAKGAAAEASLMVNRYELYGSRYSDVYDYARNSGWFARAASVMDSGSSSDDVVTAVTAVIKQGYRTLPQYVDEHDCYSDLSSVSNNGQTFDVNDTSKYKQYITKIHNKYGSTYTFFSRPDTNSDPFGYINAKYRNKFGDAYYEFGTWKLINGKEDSNTTTNNNNSTTNEEDNKEVGDTSTGKNFGKGDLAWPTPSTTISSTFGPRSAPISGASTNHGAVDISGNRGDNVWACEEGTVLYTYNVAVEGDLGANGHAGNWVVIDHGNNYVTKYMHLKQGSVVVNPGDTVKKGQKIAELGSTGNSTEPHLHFQVEKNGTKVDPMDFAYDKNLGNNSSSGSSANSSSTGDGGKYCVQVATWSETSTSSSSTDSSVQTDGESTTYNMTTTNINYQQFTSGYTMPFDYLWALLVIGEDKDFVFELSDLVYGSELEITIHDDLTVNTTTITDQYQKEKKTKTTATATVNYGTDANNIAGTAQASGDWEDIKTPTDSDEKYTITNTTVTKTNTLDIALTKANVWIVDYEQEFTYQKPEATTTETGFQPSNPDHTDFKDTADEQTDGVDTYGHGAQLLEDTKVPYNPPTYAYVDGSFTVHEDIFYREVNKKRNVKDVVETSEYVSSPATLDEKTDPDAQEDNFCTILLKDECKKAKKYILEVSQWLFEILENNDSTKDMVDLTKYLLYKATGRSFGVTEYDFGPYDPSNFSDFSDSGYSSYIVKTTDSDAAPVVDDKTKLENGLKKWLRSSGGMKDNSLSVLDTVMDCQEKYNVNAVFVYAFLRTETGIGTADTNYVKVDNNWGSWNLGHKFSSPQENIETITRNMKNGGIYFDKNISVEQIGAIYCPNTPQYPDQADKWIKQVQDYMTELYKACGVEIPAGGSGSVAEGGEGTIGVYTSTFGKTYNLYIQGTPAPWAGESYGDGGSNPANMTYAGCGPTAEAIIASAYDGKITPSTARQDIVNKLGRGNHSSAEWIGQSLKRLIPRIKTSTGSFDETKIKNCIKSGGQVWLVVKYCKYTTGHHCIALIDYKETGKVYVAHGTEDHRPYGWGDLSYVKSNHDGTSVLYVGGN